MNDIEAGVYVYRRRIAALVHPFQETDCFFGGARLDEARIQNGDFEHCTFADVSFKKAILQNIEFQHCVFVGCYFRRAELIDCAFVGCRFVDCNFNHVAIKSCDFRYASFSGCQLPFDELENSLPSEPNLREDLARNLCLESTRLGLSAEARRYRMEEIKSRERNLWEAVLAKSRWYQEHYAGIHRLRALTEYVLSLLNRWLWGYGQQSWVLVRNLVIAGCFLFPAIFYFLRDGLEKASSAQVTVADLVCFSFENILPSGIHSGIQAISFGARIAAGAEAIVGIVALALFASYVFRWSLHR
jgi:hypothetical protein